MQLKKAPRDHGANGLRASMMGYEGSIVDMGGDGFLWSVMCYDGVNPAKWSRSVENSEKQCESAFSSFLNGLIPKAIPCWEAS